MPVQVDRIGQALDALQAMPAGKLLASRTAAGLELHQSFKPDSWPAKARLAAV